jgi:hypothetical protein
MEKNPYLEILGVRPKNKFESNYIARLHYFSPYPFLNYINFEYP